MEDRKNRKPSHRLSLGGALLRTALIMLCLILLTVHLMGSLYAKYTAAGGGEDSARVAKFDVNVSGALDSSKIECSVVANGNSTYTITIENKSEVAVHYDLSVAVSGNTDGVSWEFDSKEGDLAVGGKGENTLTFSVNWDQFTKVPTGSTASVNLEFTVTVNVTQID